MTILVVKTCDGNVYYRKSQWKSATRMAAQQILSYDLSRWNNEEVVAMRTASEMHRDEDKCLKGMYEVALDIAAIVVAEVR